MKVLMVTPYFRPRIGGLENYAFGISRSLARTQGCSVEVLTSERVERPVTEQMCEMTVHRYPISFVIWSTPVGTKWWWQVRSVIREVRPDVVNVHLPVPGISDIAVAVSGKTPCVVTYHNDLVKESWLGRAVSTAYSRSVLLATLARCDGVIATSELYARRSVPLKAVGGKLSIVPPGVDTSIYYPSAGSVRNSDIPVVAFVAALRRTHRHKGLDILMRAVKEVQRRQRVLLRVVGGGDALIEYKRLAEDLGIGGSTEFLGAVSDAQLREVYSSANVVVLPSVNSAEGFGMVLAEAQACGTAVVGTRVGGIPAALRENETGLLVPPGDVAALATALNRLLRDEALQARFGEQGHAWVHGSLAWDVLAAKTMSVYEQVVSRHERGIDLRGLRPSRPSLETSKS